MLDRAKVTGWHKKHRQKGPPYHTGLGWGHQPREMRSGRMNRHETSEGMTEKDLLGRAGIEPREARRCWILPGKSHRLSRLEKGFRLRADALLAWQGSCAWGQ